MAGLLEEIRGKIDCRSVGEVRQITAGQVKLACQRMKPAKTDVSESYSSDVFLHAPDIMFQHLAAAFRSCLVHGTLPLHILVCSFMPLLKPRKRPEKFDSWRAVAGASQMLKLLEYVILNLWGGQLESESVQFGYKEGTGTDQCSWLLVTVAEYFRQRGSSTICCLLDVSKGFDRVKFFDLFEILLREKEVPAIVVRLLAFMYMEQRGFVRLAGRKSASFRLTNGTRQGAAASPALWSAYVDGLLQELRRRGLGCYVAGMWMGAFCYVDDLSLIAPTRQTMDAMLRVVERFGAARNLRFSSDPNPRLSKSKCILFSRTESSYPEPLVLNGETLPWVESALHLGHTLHRSGSMEQDCKVRRAIFISRSLEVREQFGFAIPTQQLRAIQILCCDAYGSPLWRLDSAAATSFFKAWSGCVRRVYRLPLNTFTYLVEGHLASGFVPVRNQVLSRYAGFYHRLLDSPSPEVRVMASLAASSACTVTAGNLAHIAELSRRDPVLDSHREIRRCLPVREVPEGERWRLGLLDHLLQLRSNTSDKKELVKLVAMISSLCST